MAAARAFLKALPHGDIQQVLPGIYFVSGTMTMPGSSSMRFSRNMTVIEAAGALTLVNSVRLDEQGLEQLEKLGTVENVIRLAGFHGVDDPFYKDRYSAKIWSVNAPYTKGFKTSPTAEDIYFTPDVILDASSPLPVDNAKLIEFKTSTPGEALLLLEREGGVLISGDCLQNWAKTDRYFSFSAKLIMKLMGFIKPYNIGPGWLKAATPDRNEIKSILDFEFAHVLPAHGLPVIGDAKACYKPTISKL